MWVQYRTAGDFEPRERDPSPRPKSDMEMDLFYGFLIVDVGNV